MSLPINNGIKKYADKGRISFAMPGHKGKRKSDINNLFRLDVTELDDTDNLLCPSSYIRESEQKLSEIYGTVSSHYLLGGSSCGIYTMLSLAVSEGDKVITDRFCHKSVINAIILCGAVPVYVTPERNGQFGFTGGVLAYDIECAVKAHPDAKAVIITSPTYYGTVSDIYSISDIVHQAGMLFLVDEAHGAHFHASSLLPESAVKNGADMVVQSIHKTLGAFSGGALLHINNHSIDYLRLQNALAMYQTSSPSYACLCVLEEAVADTLKMEGKYRELIGVIDKCKNKVNALGKAYWVGEELVGNCGIFAMDKTRIVINFSKLSITGYGAAEILRNRYNIEVEMADSNNIVCIATPYNTKADITALAKAVIGMVKNMQTTNHRTENYAYFAPEIVTTPRKAHFSPWETVDMSEAVGRVCAVTVCKYPPGIPLLVPGERIYAEHIKAITATEEIGGNITGIREDHRIDVVK